MNDILYDHEIICRLSSELKAAKAEIERLCDENEAWQVGQEAITDQLSMRNREITRLRAVIRDAADDLLTPDALRAALEQRK